MKDSIIQLSHGGGGKKMDELIHYISLKIGIENQDSDIIGPSDADDGAIVSFQSQHRAIVITTDSHTVDPIFFKGGNIGDLSICGTINDLVCMGAEPLYLTLGMVIEEGFAVKDLGRICETMQDRLEESNVRIVAGDTKVMPKGMVSDIIINTAGFGKVVREIPLGDKYAQDGDDIIITGSIGDHGSSLIALREGIELETDLESDVASFWPYFKEIIQFDGVHAMKDLTRGGFASGSNEIAKKSRVCLEIIENAIPIKEEAQAICDILGLEILDISCEGQALIIADPAVSDKILSILHEHPQWAMARIIGTVKSEPKGRVLIKTEIGGTRILDKPFGEPIPRVC